LSIHFKSVRWKNFLSTGDEFTSVQLDRTPTTLIVGSNGAGKSTMLDALSFGLFGKPHRDIKKDQLINSINKKHAVVEVEFNVGKQEFRIVRSIKPNKFEIYQNGNLINQSSTVRDYQKFLEQNILKLNHKSFHQVVVLGSSSFIPFMQMPIWSRREVIEDLLDINIFTKMNGLLKERNSKIKEEIKDITHQIDLVNTRIDGQSKYIKNLESLNTDQISQKHDSISDLKGSINDLLEQSQDLGKNLPILIESQEAEYKKNNVSVNQMSSYDMQFNTKMKSLVKESKFYTDNDNCPTCDQVITEEKKSEKVSEISAKAKELNKASDDLKKKLVEANHEVETSKAKLKELQDRQTKILGNNDKIGIFQNEINRTLKEIEKLTGQTGDINQAKNELDGLRENKDTQTERKLKYLEERTYNEIIAELLKDTGIKTKIIKQYLPVMNKLINNYLQVLDFFVSFHLDETFTETIRSRHRDNFNYSSFSEGEKQRIDLALLFTWRQIAKMKNSASTNLLVLDETFDSSLDHDGIDNLTKILDTLEEGSNVFIISHKGDILENKFRSKIEFYKEHNFSKIK
jgi:DNA repair exonuclease SbcCD ATPase subunit